MRIFSMSGLCLLWLVLSPASRGQTPVFDRPQFHSASELALQGDATVTGGRLRLTPGEAGRVGGAWYFHKRVLAAGFETTFTFQLSGAGGGGGEGLAFVIQNNAVPALGPAGGAIGYGGILNSLAVEFDTRNNGTNDAPANHLSVQARGTPASLQTNSADHAASLGAVTNGLPDFADGNTHAARIVYQSGALQVFVDGGQAPALDLALDLSSRLALDRGQGWFGFTAANGPGYQTQEILSWSFATAPTPVSVTITSPMEESSFVAPALVPLAASAASTGGGGIARVEYFQGTRKLGQAASSPYNFSWENVAPGTYLVTATAFDDQGRTNVSAPIGVTVLAATPSIGINFVPNAAGANEALAATELAGTVPQRNWNNVLVFTNGAVAGPNLKNAIGLGTTVDVSADFATPGEQLAVNASLSSDHKLMKGFGSDQAGTTGFQTNSVINVSQVPFPIYDVIVYSDGNNNGGDRVVQFRLGTNIVFLRDAAWASFSGIYAQASGPGDQGKNTSAGNYVRFNGLTAANFSISATARSSTDATPRGAVNALQIIPSVYDTTFPPTITRGPYLQSATPHSIIVRWRTNRPVNSRVRYGTGEANLDQVADDAVSTSEHTVALTNLLPDTRYSYSIGTTATNLTSGPEYSFVTSPTAGKSTRIWVIGDSGTADERPAAVRDAYLELTGDRSTDLWLMLGDNAYNSGQDTEYQAAVFNMYPMLLRQTPLWSCVGNHETSQSHTYSANIPYYRIFDFPKNGEAGGVASGTEQYYSFDYGNIHFVCLDAMTSDRSSNGVMCTWLRQDLEANTNFWLIAYWHHPPYTKGSHDSDNDDGADPELVEMRENVLPILESYSVDLVLSGHSHNYERSFLMHGHYSYSTNLLPSMIVDGSSGNFDQDLPYVKGPTTPTPYLGTVYVVAGSSGQATFVQPDGPHPAMFMSLLQLGSLVVDVNGNRLDGRFLRETGNVEDYFTIFKLAPAAAASGFQVIAASLDGGKVSLRWNASPGKSYVVQRTVSLTSPVWQAVSQPLEATTETMSWSAPAAPGSVSAFYRVVCEGN